MKNYTLKLATLCFIWSIFACTPTATCFDGIHNGDEIDIDCGGPTCNACISCSDGIMNGTETDIDCGGTICTPCDSCVTCGHPMLSPYTMCLSSLNYDQAQMDTNIAAYISAGYTCN